MAAKKKKSKGSSSATITLKGGPKDGESGTVNAAAIPPRIRYAWPEWCNYYRQGDSLLYQYDMETEWVTLTWQEMSNLKNGKVE